MPYPATLDEICAALTARGCPALARRLAYFASDADLEPGDVHLCPIGFMLYFPPEKFNRTRRGCNRIKARFEIRKYENLRHLGL